MMMESGSTNITAIIADDELLARDLIRNYLSAFPRIKIIAECNNGLMTLNEINRLEPDLVFLDIQMPELDGMSVLNELKKMPMIIFTTAFNQYAIKAFELNAIDYLLKPFDRDRFGKAIKKVLEYRSIPSVMDHKLGSLQQTMNSLLTPENKLISRILIKGKTGYSFLNVEDIIWFEAYSDYIKIHTKDKTYLKNISLAEMESKLDPQHFLRIHRSSIINLAFVKEMKPYSNGEYFIYLTNGEKVKLSRTYKDKIEILLRESI
jgi:two-component system LytT family response regulator